MDWLGEMLAGGGPGTGQISDRIAVKFGERFNMDHGDRYFTPWETDTLSLRTE